MANLGYDSSLSFGTVAASGVFPNIVDLGPDTPSARMAVDLIPDRELAGGASLEIYGGDTEETQDAQLGARAFTAGEMNGRETACVALGPHGYRYLKAAVTGTDEANYEAVINTRVGL
jgi:hypothetical protein